MERIWWEHAYGKIYIWKNINIEKHIYKERYIWEDIHRVTYKEIFLTIQRFFKKVIL